MAKKGKNYTKIAGTWEQIKPSYNDLEDIPTSFTPTSHTHTKSDITDFSHTHTLSEVTDAGTVAAIDTNASTTQFLRGDGTWATPADSTTLTSLGITATAAELNKLDGVTATTTEINYIDGVTSSIQTQLNGKAASSHTHTKSDITDFSHTHAISEVTNLQTSLNLKANLASPALTGTPTAPTASSGVNTTQIATTAFVQNALTGVTGGLNFEGVIDLSGIGGKNGDDLAAAGLTAPGDYLIVSATGVINNDGSPLVTLAVQAPGDEGDSTLPVTLETGDWIVYVSGSGTTMTVSIINNTDTRFAPTVHTHDDRYYTETESDSRFVNTTGDTMTGNLRIDSGSFASLILDRGTTGSGSIVQFENNNGLIGAVGAFGDDGLQFRTRDGTQMVIDANNNVGIGTTSPTEKLTVYGTSTTSENSPVAFFKHNFTGTHGFGISVSRDDSDIAALALGADSSNNGIVVANNTDLILGTINSGTINDAIVVKNTGNVGIGTTSPGYKLQVNGSFNATDPMINSASTSNDVSVMQWRYGTSDAYRLRLKQSVTSGVVRWNFSQTNNNTDYNDVLVLDRGNVGIGTTSPGYKLNIQGANETGIRMDSGSYFGILGIVETAGLLATTSTAGDVVLRSESANILFSASSTERMRLTNGGNLGIGTTSPGTKLDVSGNIRATTDMYVGSAIYHDGDTNTYMQFHAADQWRVVTGGVERLEVNNSAVTVSGALTVNGNTVWHNGNFEPNVDTIDVLPTYGASNEDFIKYNTTERAVEIQSSSDENFGAVYPAIKTESGVSYKISFSIKSNTTSSDGVYFRIQEYDAALPDGKTHIASSATHPEVQEDTRQVTSFYENDAVGTNWKQMSFFYTPAASCVWFSPMFLNWTGLSTNSLFVKNLRVDAIQENSTNANTLDNLDSSQFLRSDTADTATGKITFATGLARSTHATGHLEGSYNNVGANETRSNPIYTIGSSYNPADTTLGNMYGIGFTYTNAGFINFSGGSGWGLYVASDGDARVWLNASTGTIASTGEHYVGSSRVFHDTYHPNADKWTTARTLSLSGDASGSVSWDGSANATLSVTVNNNSHSHSSVTDYAPYLYTRDNRTIAPSEDVAYRLKYGFTSWNNNSTSPYADYLHMRSYSDSSGGNDNLVMFRKDAIGMRIWQQSFGSSTAYSSYKDVAFTDSYASSTTGGTVKMRVSGSTLYIRNDGTNA
jgi:hypothetical protein